ncbi:hypothetical protein LB521_27960 [Mesorhizobium sp. BR-1-1-8]|uniref:hypothetical protein n=1 Tax=unclassified Mesorhizobium TaxID=325217 RepID=UPI001CCFF24A|nr:MULTISPECIES: hypothetical protein [unclassified Mesorhizobium]MBZ9973470.1 hypothetical protein [Mesorhizobium sp. BR1-1-12]MBZ9984974.1 hypothetical protein [Mesorhizobium sp. BR-1-1-8]
MATKLTEVYQTEDGRIFATLKDAEAHEAAQAMLRAIRQARADANYDSFGRTHPLKLDERLAEELVRAGFVLGRRP